MWVSALLALIEQPTKLIERVQWDGRQTLTKNPKSRLTGQSSPGKGWNTMSQLARPVKYDLCAVYLDQSVSAWFICRGYSGPCQGCD